MRTWLFARTPLVLLSLGGGIACALVALTVGLMDGTDSAQAQPPLIVGIDMDTTGNACPGDGVTDCTLGTIDRCLATSAGSTIDFDVFLDGIPNGDGMLSYVYDLGDWPGTLQDPDGGSPLPHQHTNVNLVVQAVPSSVLDLSQGLPDASPPWSAAVADFGSAEYNPPFTQGVLGRYSVDTTGAAAGVYTMTLSNVVIGDDFGQDLCVLHGCTI